MNSDNDLIDIRDQLREFAAERDWDQFHSPKNLAMALAGETGELLEHFQWLTEEQSANLSDEVRAEVAHELADVLIYLVRIADKLDIDLSDAVAEKMKLNEQKYPAEQVKGSSQKHSKY